MSTQKSRIKEAGVIDEILLSRGVRLDTSIDNQRRPIVDVDLVAAAPVAKELLLSFQHIHRIENLAGFNSLLKLCLDNNQIKEIAGLSHLVHLQWLDLSFNKIHKVQGLDALVHLEDLSLFSNSITVIENLDGCTELRCLSFGNNKIDTLDQITRLRKLRRLRMLVLAGNPICSQTDYRMTVLAFVNMLTYLDYSLVEKADLLLAKEQCQDELIDIEEKESVECERAARDRQQEGYMNQLREAGIVFAHSLFDDMFNDDQDLRKLKSLPGVAELTEGARSKFSVLSEQFIEASMEKHRILKEATQSFLCALSNMRRTDNAESITIVEEFLRNKKRTQHALAEDDEAEQLNMNHRRALVDVALQQLDVVSDTLFDIEVRQVENFEHLIDEFDGRMNEFKIATLEAHHSFFRAVEELEERFSAELRVLIGDLLECLSKDDITETQLNDDAMAMLVDKDFCMSSVSGSHDMHLGKLLKKEDEARALEMRRYHGQLTAIGDEERAHNRKRVLEIHDLTSEHSESLHNALRGDDDEEEDVLEEQDRAYDGHGMY